MKINNRETIRLIAEDRGVIYLMHFTQIANLPGIMDHGLLSRRTLAESKYLACASDQYRLDESEDAVSVAVSRVNEVMFAAKRRKSGHSDHPITHKSSQRVHSSHSIGLSC